MAFEGLPPSPNWYSSTASDTNQDGVLAYASRNSVSLLNISDDGQTLIGYLHGHEQRVAAVAFNKLDNQLLATCGDDCMVKIWNWHSKSVIKEHKSHESKVTCVSWNPSNKDVLTTGDDKGNIVSWNQSEDEVKSWSQEKNPIACLAYSNTSEQYLAVGYKSGKIYVIDLRKKKPTVVSKLRGHDDEVQSMCWSPTSSQSANGSSLSDLGAETESLLLSGGKDQHIRLWSLSQDKMLHAFKLPAKGGSRSRNRGDDSSSRARLWVSVWWPHDQPKQFLSSSFGGDILLWDLNKSGKQKWVSLGQGSSETHNRPVFSLLPVRDKYFLTSSMDRQLILWDRETCAPHWSTPTLGGFIYQLAVAPQDTATIAMGVGDNMIRVWNTQGRGASCKSTSLWQGLKSKVTAICWHPEREGLLAFGTEDGRIGMFTSINPTKAPILSRTFHKKTVYSLSFGPYCYIKDDDGNKAENEVMICLYSCGGEGVVYQHHATSLNEEAVCIDTIIRSTNTLQHMLPLRSEVSWRSDRSFVAIGNDDGSIEVLGAPHLLLLCTIQVHHKIINCLQWFPSQIPQGQSSLRFCLASGSNETVVHVHDLSNVLGQETLIPMPAPISSAFRSLNGHMLRVTTLQWNPLADGKLASVSYDGTAQIWDVDTGEALANFRGHQGRLLSLAWSHLDPDILFTGGEDFCVMKWKISECTHKQPPKDKKELNLKFYNSGASNREGKKKKNKSKGSSVFSKGAIKSTSSNEGTSPSPMNGKDVSSTNGGLDATAKTVSEMKDTTPKSPSAFPSVPEKDLKQIVQLLEEKKRELSLEGVADGLSRGLEGKSGEVTEGRGLDPAGRHVKDGEDEEKDVKKHLEEADTWEDVQKVGSKTKRKKGKSYFPVCSQLDNRGKHWFLKDCVDIAERKYGKTTDLLQQDSVPAGLFTSRKDLSQTMTIEGNHHQEHGNIDIRLWLDVWQGKLLNVLRDATHRGQLNDKMVAMAPQVGHDVWLETCRAYAKQLEQNGDPQKAATYYVCCHQIQQAVKVLKENKHFREAASLATSRLAHGDAMRLDVFQSWGKQLEADHSYEAAARCCLAIDKPENAVRLLARSGSQSALKAALDVAILTDQKDVLCSQVPRYANKCMLNGDWSEAWDLSTDDISILCLHLVMIIHEALIITLRRTAGSVMTDMYNKPKFSHHLPEVSEHGQDSFSGWPCLSVDGTTLLSAAISVWETQDHPWEKATKTDILESLDKLFVPSFDLRVPKQFFISGAVCVALDFLESTSVSERSYSHVEKILKECYQAGDLTLMKAILSLVYPKGFFVDKLSMSPLVVPGNKDSSVRPTEAYYAYTVLYHLWWNCPGRISHLAAQEPSTNSASVHGTKINSDSSAQGATAQQTSSNEGEEGGGGGGGGEALASDEQRDSSTQNGSANISHGSIPSPLTCTETTTQESIAQDSEINTDKALPDVKTARDSSNEMNGDSKTSSWQHEERDHECPERGKAKLQPFAQDAQGEVHTDMEWCKFAWIRTKICKDVLVKRKPLQWYRLSAELQQIGIARKALSDGGGELKSDSIGGEPSLPLNDSNLKGQTDGIVPEISSCQDTMEGSDLSTGENDIQELQPEGVVLPDEHLPIFERYLRPSITEVTLTENEARLQEELDSLNMGSEAPDPHESMLVIASLLTNIFLAGYCEPDSKFVLQGLVKFETKHICTKSQLKHFLRLKRKLEETLQRGEEPS